MACGADPHGPLIGRIPPANLGRLVTYHPWKFIGAWIVVALLVALCAPHWEAQAEDDDIRFIPARPGDR